MAAAFAVKPDAQSEMFSADVPERERTTLGSLHAHGKNARVAVNRSSLSASRRGRHCEVWFRTDFKHCNTVSRKTENNNILCITLTNSNKLF